MRPSLKPKNPTPRVQAAMEYLMTYGWAILVIAIVLGVLYYFGVFGGVSTGNACIAGGGYLCNSPKMNSSGYLAINFAISGSPITIVGINCTSNSTQPTLYQPIASTELQNGNIAYITMKCFGGAAGPIGKKYSGYLWINYSTSTQNSLYAKVAIVTVEVSSVNPLPASSLVTSTIPAYTYNALSSITSNDVSTASVPSNSVSYFCTGTVNYNPPTAQSWTVLGSLSGGSVGYQSNSVCSISQSSSCLTGNNCAGTVGAIGVNSLFTTRASGALSTNTLSISYNVGDTSQQTFIVFSAVEALTVNAVTGCTVLENIVIVSSTYQTYLAECQGQSVGSHSLTGTTIGGYPTQSSVSYAVFSDD